jgi:hypothetical protein
VLGVINADTDSFIESVPTGNERAFGRRRREEQCDLRAVGGAEPACPNGCIGVYQAK